jgi:transposase
MGSLKSEKESFEKAIEMLDSLNIKVEAFALTNIPVILLC